MSEALFTAAEQEAGFRLLLELTGTSYEDEQSDGAQFRPDEHEFMQEEVVMILRAAALVRAGMTAEQAADKIVQEWHEAAFDGESCVVLQLNPNRD